MTSRILFSFLFILLCNFNFAEDPSPIETYTIDAAVFAGTYRELSPGVYGKSTSIWAHVAVEAGQVETVEGVSHYEAGDYLVSNNEDGSDAYCISAEKFAEMYELDE